jgi:hypothetical protein
VPNAESYCLVKLTVIASFTWIVVQADFGRFLLMRRPEGALKFEIEGLAGLNQRPIFLWSNRSR